MSLQSNKNHFRAFKQKHERTETEEGRRLEDDERFLHKKDRNVPANGKQTLSVPDRGDEVMIRL